MVTNPYSKNTSNKTQTIHSPIKNKKFAYSPPYISATLKNRMQYQKFKPIALNPKLGEKMAKAKESIKPEYYKT